MEDTLRDTATLELLKKGVLILVLMEDTLRGVNISRTAYLSFSLNPCFNGRYSQSL